MSHKFIISKCEKRFIRREMINAILSAHIARKLPLHTIKRQVKLQERTYYGQEMKITWSQS